MIHNKEKYFHILDEYFPFFTAIPTEEEQKLIQDGKMSLKNIKEPYFKSMFREWLGWILKSDQMEDAISFLQERLSMRTSEEEEQLMGHVLAACFLASNYKELAANAPEGKREQRQNHIDKLEPILKDISKLQQSISKLKIPIDPHFASQNPFKEDQSLPSFLTPEEYQIVSHFLGPYDPKISDPELSMDKFGKVLSVYHKLVKFELGKIKQSASPENLGHYFRETGPLKYPKKLSSSQHSSNPGLNGLTFYLALLFRQFTDLNNKGKWLARRTGAMPTTGEPCHKINADFVNATFFNTKAKKQADNPTQVKSKEGELDENSIAQRLLPFSPDKGVEFTSW
jgi:hypothetical protein